MAPVLDQIFHFALATVILIQVEERRKEALSRTGEEGASPLENSLQDVVSRYSFMDLWPCSSKDMDHLARQEVPSFYKSGWLPHLYINKNDELFTSSGLFILILIYMLWYLFAFITFLVFTRKSFALFRDWL